MTVRSELRSLDNMGAERHCRREPAPKVRLTGDARYIPLPSAQIVLRDAIMAELRAQIRAPRSRALALASLEVTAEEGTVPTPYAWATLAALRNAKGDVAGSVSAMRRCQRSPAADLICGMTYLRVRRQPYAAE